MVSATPDAMSRRKPALRSLAGALLALVVAAFCYAPALHAYFAADDLAFLALVRLLDQPWLLFVHDHFPASVYFRPFGVLVWWIVCAFYGAAAWPQYAVNLLLHAGCVVALYALLQRMHRDVWRNALWAALYAAHPIAVGTGFWLSDRFDLMTTLFSLFAVNAALAYAARPRNATLAVTLSMLLLGLLSKELGIVASAAAFAAIAFSPRRSSSLAQRATALASIAALTLLWLAYRHAMLTTIPGFSGSLISPATFVDGAWRWLRTGFELLVSDPRLAVWNIALLSCAAVLWVAAAIAARIGQRVEGGRWHAAAAAATLCLLPGLVQAPVAVHHLGDVDAHSLWSGLVVTSRFYHLALAGLICALMLVASPLVVRSTRRQKSQLALMAALVLAVVALAPASQRAAHAYASETRGQIAPLHALDVAVSQMDLPDRGCQVYFLDAGAIAGLSGYSDSIAKGLAADPAPRAHCLFASERPPYTYFVRTGSVTPDDYRPLHPVTLAGHVVPPLTLGSVQAMYFTMGEDFTAELPAHAIFLVYRDGEFVNVSDDVRAGRRKVDCVLTRN